MGHGTAYAGLAKSVPRTRPFGEYRLLAKVEHSGLAEGFLARLADRPRELRLVRRLHGHLERLPGYVAMFAEQGERASRVEHPSAVRVLERGEIGGRHFTAYEWLEGRTLGQLLAERGAAGGLPVPVALRIAGDVVAALDAAQRSGEPGAVAHGDVSPDDVVLTFDGRVVLVGFGAIRPNDPRLSPELTAVSGGYGHAAPESARGEAVDVRADVWSVGVLLWESIAGRPLFAEKSEAAVLRRLLGGEIGSLDEVAGAPKPLARVVAACLCRDRDLRPATPAALAERLARVCPERADDAELAAIVRATFPDAAREDARILAELTGRRSALVDARSAASTTSPAMLVGLVIALAVALVAVWAGLVS